MNALPCDTQMLHVGRGLGSVSSGGCEARYRCSTAGGTESSAAVSKPWLSRHRQRRHRSGADIDDEEDLESSVAIAETNIDRHSPSRTTENQLAPETARVGGRLSSPGTGSALEPPNSSVCDDSDSSLCGDLPL